jgi:hypothetical protein
MPLVRQALQEVRASEFVDEPVTPLVRQALQEVRASEAGVAGRQALSAAPACRKCGQVRQVRASEFVAP